MIRVVFLVALLFPLGGCVYYLNPLCTDMIKNGDETDIDCGGPCSKCAIGDRCDTDADCDKSICNGGTCVPLPCDNGVKDLAETDVDCGGDTCRKCAGGRGCTAGSDCFSDNCTAANTCFALTVSFADQVPYESGDKTYAIFNGDLDGDGDIDLVAANEQASNLSVFLNQNNTGTFVKGPTQFACGEYPTGGTIVDINKDGKQDVITADYHGDSVSVLLGTGTGTLGTAATYPTVDGAETSNLAVGDLDGDNIVDVLATNPMAGSVSLFLANADGSLRPAQDILIGITAASNPYSAGIGDFNKDGKNDIAVADSRSFGIIVRLGNGDGTFQPEVTFSEGGTPPYILVTGDVDVDGEVDLVIANRGSDNVSVLSGRGDGSFRKPIVSSTGEATGPYAIAIADFNQDGVPDVVTSNFMSSTASVLLGIGTGGFDAPINAGPVGNATYGITAGNFNADMKPDFATANANTNNITVKLNTSN
jgi:hypothetical protein